MDQQTRTPQDPETLPAGSTAKSAAGLLEGFVRDGLVNGSVLLSLIVVVASVVAPGTAWVLGLLVGIPGIVLPWLAVGRKWAIGTTWVAVFSVIVVDLAALTLMWTTA